MKIKPVTNFLHIKILMTEQKTKSGLHLPSSETNTRKGIVMEVGPGKINDRGERLPMEAKVGDKVLLPLYQGFHTENYGEDEMVLIEDKLILGIIQE